MNTKLWLHNAVMPLILIGLMALTRFNHFGTAFSLPDASLAVFFFAGLGVTGYWFLAVLLMEAGLIDYLAISQMAVSDFCITPAYAFLIPAYAVMWWAGRYCKACADWQVASTLKAFVALGVAVSLSFLISNGSFYLVSGSFGAPGLDKYLEQLVHYYPPYLMSTLVYGVAGLALHRMWQSMNDIFLGSLTNFYK
ncbi:MAG: hypothetical protein FJ190_00445 [Gammaproteobacteria bacterium]|nr:hypothetical protein [Gammaproteobacteria bacterium]